MTHDIDHLGVLCLLIWYVQIDFTCRIDSQMLKYANFTQVKQILPKKKKLKRLLFFSKSHFRFYTWASEKTSTVLW